jgi:hypothetical protein
MGKWQEAAVLATLTMGLLAHAGEQEQQALANGHACGRANGSYEAHHPGDVGTTVRSMWWT